MSQMEQSHFDRRWTKNPWIMGYWVTRDMQATNSNDFIGTVSLTQRAHELTEDICQMLQIQLIRIWKRIQIDV